MRANQSLARVFNRLLLTFRICAIGGTSTVLRAVQVTTMFTAELATAGTVTVDLGSLQVETAIASGAVVLQFSRECLPVKLQLLARQVRVLEGRR
jgi:hypothetical protein